MSTDKFRVRKMSASEVSFAIKLAAAEGWNPGIYDAESFYSADPKGFFVGLLGEEKIGTISAVAYDDYYGFMGLWIVRTEFQGNHYGSQLWDAAIKYLGDRDIGLDGITAMEPRYKQKGFETAYYSSRFEKNVTDRFKVDTRVVDLAKINIEEVLRYDDLLFSVSRHKFVANWISQKQCIALGIIEDGNLFGYGVARKCRSGYKIGPLFANNEIYAEEIFRAIYNQLPKGTLLFLDIPEANPAAVELVARHKMRKVFETARMYRLQRSDELNLPIEKWFGVTSFELG